MKNAVIVAGSRTITDYSLVEAAILESGFQIDEVVSGGARGPDSFSAIWAKKNNVPVKFFIPDWNGLGKYAGFVRNEQMARYGSHLILVWDGKSRGSLSMLQLAKRYELVIFEKVV